MTDEQWLWVYVNMILENDELLDGMCPKCRTEATSKDRCTRCGKNLTSSGESFVNPNFDKNRFQHLSHEDDAIMISDNGIGK